MNCCSSHPNYLLYAKPQNNLIKFQIGPETKSEKTYVTNRFPFPWFINAMLKDKDMLDLIDTFKVCFLQARS